MRDDVDALRAAAAGKAPDLGALAGSARELLFTNTEWLAGVGAQAEAAKHQAGQACRSAQRRLGSDADAEALAVAALERAVLARQRELAAHQHAAELHEHAAELHERLGRPERARAARAHAMIARERYQQGLSGPEHTAAS